MALHTPLWWTSFFFLQVKYFKLDVDVVEVGSLTELSWCLSYMHMSSKAPGPEVCCLLV